MKGYQGILDYVNTTRYYKLWLGSQNGEIELFGCSDASYKVGNDGKGRLGVALFLSPFSGAFCTISRKENTVSHSSMECEIHAVDAVIRYIIYFRELLSEINIIQNKPTKLYMDSKSGIQLCETMKNNFRTRHMTVNVAFIREQINARIVELIFVRDEYNVADILTKLPLSKERHMINTRRILEGFTHEEWERMNSNNNNK